MSSKPELPRGLQYRGSNLVAVFVLASGTIERRSLGRMSVPDAEAALVLFKKAVRDGVYQKKQKRVKAAKPVPEVAILVRDLWPGYLQNYLNEGGRDAGRQKIAWKHLEPSFGNVPVEQVTTGHVRDYIALRQGKGIKGGTINRELIVLKAAFKLGTESSAANAKPMVDRLPTWPGKLKEGAPRKNFLTDQQFAVFMKHAKPWLRAFLETDYSFGFRKSELLNLRVGQVNLIDRVFRLEADDTKTDEARTVPMTAAVFAHMVACCKNKKDADFVFTRENGGRVTDPRDDWQAAAVAAKLGKFTAAKGKRGPYQKYTGINPHDLRRSAARNMKRRGVSDNIIMNIGGWSTAATFRRYDITDEADLKDAAKRIEAGREVVPQVVPQESNTTDVVVVN
jgi:integrase